MTFIRRFLAFFTDGPIEGAEFHLEIVIGQAGSIIIGYVEKFEDLHAVDEDQILPISAINGLGDPE